MVLTKTSTLCEIGDNYSEFHYTEKHALLLRICGQTKVRQGSSTFAEGIEGRIGMEEAAANVLLPEELE